MAPSPPDSASWSSGMNFRTGMFGPNRSWMDGTPPRWSWCQCVTTICSMASQPHCRIASSRVSRYSSRPSPESMRIFRGPRPTR